MAIIHKPTFTCHFVNSDTEKQFPDKASALAAAEAYCGNRSCVKPFPREETYLFGPGDGTTSVMVRQDIEFSDEKGGA
jgi:hypothetical protein